MSFFRREPRPNPTEGWAFAKPTRVPKERTDGRRSNSIRSNGQKKRVVREAIYRPYVDWLHADGAVCVVCGMAIAERIQGAHVGQGGTGKTHGTAADTIRLCADSSRGPGCHTQHDRNGTLPGFFHLWSRQRLRAWDRDQRLAHWEAFRAAAGIALTSNCVGVRGTIEEWLACDAAIAERMAQLRIGG